MNILYSGNDAISRGAYESGVKVVTGYPGTPCTEIVSNFFEKYTEVDCEWSVNEKVALEVAIGASFAGYRSMSVMKTVGLNVAHDALMSAAQSQINGGLVIVVGDDTGRITDDYNDCRYYGDSANIPVLEPSDAQEALELIKLAFSISEIYCLPVIVRLTTITCKTLSKVTLDDIHNYKAPKRIKHNISAYSVYSTTIMLGLKRSNLEIVRQFNNDYIDNLNKLKSDISNNEKINEIIYKSKKIGFICTGTSSLYVKEVCPESSILHLRMVNPLPEDLLKNFSNQIDNIYLIEDGHDYLENKVKALGISIISIDKKKFKFLPVYTPEVIKEHILNLKIENKPLEEVPFRLPMNCAGCSHLFIYNVLKKNNIKATTDVTCGGLGILPHINAFNNAKNMGASISVAHGYNLANGNNKYVSVIGDGGFWATGHNGLLNMSFNKGNSTVIIVDNSCIAMTGGQDTPGSRYEKSGENELSISKICEAYNIKDVHTVDPYDLKTLESTILSCINNNNISIIIAKRPCLVKYKIQITEQSHIDNMQCVNCGTCLNLGCPAIVRDTLNQKINIDKNLCVGCKLCMNNCKNGAINCESI
ncbi:indolepyruvate ferredoxin oxidoreductase subunit alpha [Vibrio sp. MEBiC08052]|uniref:indolepyruvate ferredoxin oxidoreductase subunit alpha n=1 Tax=Vibrio sp. MEBiC08052 TaxID=1761910 RepID=UPI00074069DB|nr:indolepyruvate ferredoxin oxidoreductase subunit alpha [Vibrio sp. MEBiC08052]KUI99679.1 hypothetical protein VRK_11250 [Vibrio sp. MEBiC08052]